MQLLGVDIWRTDMKINLPLECEFKLKENMHGRFDCGLFMGIEASFGCVGDTPQEAAYRLMEILCHALGQYSTSSPSCDLVQASRSLRESAIA